MGKGVESWVISNGLTWYYRSVQMKMYHCALFFSFINRKILLFAKVVNCYSFGEKKCDFVTFSFFAICVIRISSIDFNEGGMWAKKKQSPWESLNLMLQWRGFVGEKVFWNTGKRGFGEEVRVSRKIAWWSARRAVPCTLYEMLCTTSKSFFSDVSGKDFCPYGCSTWQPQLTLSVKVSSPNICTEQYSRDVGGVRWQGDVKVHVYSLNCT